MMSSRLLLSLTLVALIGAENIAEQQQNDQIPAWYQMAKPAAGGAQRVASAGGVPVAQASPSYYERIETPTYETRREQPGFERPGIQTNQYANYPTYQNRQPYENLNALTAGASLSNLQQAAGRRYPSSVPIQAAGNDNQSAVKRYHKLLLKRRQWTTKIPRILAKSTTSPIETTTLEPITTTTQKMPKSLKSIYSTIVPKKKEEGPTTTRKVVRASTRAPMARTFKPYGTRKGWRMWKKATTAQPTTTQESTTTEVPTTTVEDVSTTTEDVTTQEILTTEEPTTSTTEEYTTLATTTEEPTTTEEITSTTEEVIPTTEDLIETSTQEEISTTTNEEEESTTTTTTTTHGPLRPIVVGTHSWKPLRFKKPQNVTDDLSTAPKGLKLLEYLLTRTDAFARGLKRAFKGPNTELLAAIKDVVAKFKASLDEAGIDQDVRQMGNQLKNTWQQLRTGTHQQGPMNEQLGKLFEKAVADAAESKQPTRNNQ